MATRFLRFILQEAPFNLTNVLLREKWVVVLEPRQQVLIPATAEELCKMYDSKHVFHPFVTRLDSSVKKINPRGPKKSSLSLVKCLACPRTERFIRKKRCCGNLKSSPRKFPRERLSNFYSNSRIRRGVGRVNRSILWELEPGHFQETPLLLFTQVLVLVLESRWFPSQITLQTNERTVIPSSLFTLSLQPLSSPYSFDWKH